MTLRPIDISGFPKVAPARDPGAPPGLAWIALDDLVIDPAYQRDITATGRRNILAIAEKFDWSAFSCVVVAACGAEGKYPVIDGQHRCHAARLAGIARVPCQIVEATATQQAKAFGRINSNVTAMPSGARFFALAASGDPDARAVLAMAEEAGVRIMKSPVPRDQMKPGQTWVCFALAKMAATHGRDMVVLALRAIVSTARADGVAPGSAGLLTAERIAGVAAAFAARRDWKPEALVEAFGSFDFGLVGALGRGSNSRAAAIAAEVGRRMDRWANDPRARREVKADAPAPAAPGGPRPAIETRRGVSLPAVNAGRGTE